MAIATTALGNLVTQEDREEDNRFGEGHGDDRLNENWRCSARIAAYGFTGLVADRCNAEWHRKCGECIYEASVDAYCCFC